MPYLKFCFIGGGGFIEENKIDEYPKFKTELN